MSCGDIKEKDDNYYTQFLKKNKEAIKWIITTFNEGSYKGLSLFYTFLTLFTILLQITVKNDILSSMMFILGFFALVRLFSNFPVSIKSFLFEKIDSDVLNNVDKEKLKYLLRVVRRINQGLNEFHKSLFVKRDLLSVSGAFSILFGFMLVLRKIQFTSVLFLTSVASTLYFCHLTSGMFLENSQELTNQ